jgi:hypothetical protein
MAVLVMLRFVSAIPETRKPAPAIETFGFYLS